MEKHTVSDSKDAPHAHQGRRRQSSHPKWMVLVGLVVLVTYTFRPNSGTWFPLNTGAKSKEKINELFDWAELTAKPHLEYVKCYEDEGDSAFYCARLELPMDYWNGTTEETVSVAVIRKPAVVPVTHPQYGGAILFNPGGPGGSGVFLVLGAAGAFQEIIDSNDGLYYDYIGFDPRGIGATTPNVRCFEDPMVYQNFVLRMNEQGVFSASDAALGRLWSMNTAWGQSCSLPLPEGDVDIKKYVGTAYVARDMVEIVERHGEWREKEAKRLLSLKGHCSGGVPKLLDSIRYMPGQEKINYWGFSYGTYLGNTFAAMFPDRINRLIVDGVVDAYDYEKTLWFDNLVDTEKGLDLFYYHCARVGFPTCPLANVTGETTEKAVKERTLKIVNSLYHDPLPIISADGPDVFTYSEIKQLLLGILYSPLGGFEFLAKLLTSIELGDLNWLAPLWGVLHSVDCPREGDERLPALGAVWGDATMAIACGDGDDQSWLTKTKFQEHVKNVTKLSPTLGEVWSELRMTCVHYNVRPVHRFKGPWVGNTSHPILEIGNSADPVTPGRYAKKMAKGFPGAVALIQDSAGHCSLSAPSNCTQQYVRQYFQTGELPPEDTICKADAIPFGPTPGEEEVFDAELQQAKERQAKISSALYAAGGGFRSGGSRAKMRNLVYSLYAAKEMLK